jgi:hypothetical protein
MITHKEYLEAQKIVDAYHSQLKQSVVSISDLSINQKVKRNYPESWDYWITEIQGEDVLIRTTENEDDPKYDDFWVNVAELRLV